MFGWGSLSLIQCAAKNFGGMLAIRLILAYVTCPDCLCQLLPVLTVC